jgi:hypothetical protein
MARKSPKMLSKYKKTCKNGKNREKTTGKNRDILFFALPCPFHLSIEPPSVIFPSSFSHPQPPSHATRHASPLPPPAGLFLPPHRGYLIGGVAIGQMAQGEAGLLCHTCVALMRRERRDHQGERPGRTKGVLQPHKTHEKKGDTHDNVCDGKKKTPPAPVVPIK